ncbi:MAG: hypothetical protein WCF90_10855 [Methanomicrobiales archaeon]
MVLQISIRSANAATIEGKSEIINWTNYADQICIGNNVFREFYKGVDRYQLAILETCTYGFSRSERVSRSSKIIK